MMYFIVNSRDSYYVDIEYDPEYNEHPIWGDFQNAIGFSTYEEAEFVKDSIDNGDGLRIVKKEIEGEDFSKYERNSYIYNNSGQTPNDPDFDPYDY